LGPSCREKRFSFSSASADKGSLSLLTSKGNAKSEFQSSQGNKLGLGYGLTGSASNSNLNVPLSSIPRSCSLYNYELDYVELKKMEITNKTSQLNGTSCLNANRPFFKPLIYDFCFFFKSQAFLLQSTWRS
jgi:hypothetical protein